MAMGGLKIPMVVEALLCGATRCRQLTSSTYIEGSHDWRLAFLGVLHHSTCLLVQMYPSHLSGVYA